MEHKKIAMKVSAVSIVINLVLSAFKLAAGIIEMYLVHLSLLLEYRYPVKNQTKNTLMGMKEWNV